MTWLTGRYEAQIWVTGQLIATKRFWRKKRAQAFQEEATVGYYGVQVTIIKR